MTGTPDGGSSQQDPDRQPGNRREEDERNNFLETMRKLNPLLSAGIQLAASVVLMFFLGRWLDEKWGTAPWMMLAGIFFGSAAGFYAFFRAVSDVNRSEKKSG